MANLCCPCPCPTAAGPGYRRFVVAWMTCLGLTLVLMMRCELGIAMLKLLEGEVERVVQHNATTHTSTVHFVRIHLVKWNHLMVGMIEAAFFVGYAVFSVPGGILATYIPATWVLGVAVSITCTLNLLIPPVVYWSHSFFWVFILRIVQGAAEGCLYPSVHALWRYWAPTTERAKLVSISFFGMALGPILGYPLTGEMIQNVDWSLPFYVYGALGIMWVVAWLLLVSSKPQSDPFISKEELEYIDQFSGPHVTAMNCLHVPWCDMLLSVPVWAIILANVGRNWIYQYSMSGLPKYYDDVYNMSEAHIGIHMMIPYVLMAIFTLIAGCTSDMIYRRFELSVGTVRKIFNTLGFSITAVSLFLLGFCQVAWLSTVTLSCVMAFLGVGMSGFAVNHLDLAPQYAGILMGMSNGMGTVSGVVSPILATKLTKTHTHHDWQMFFTISAGLELVCCGFYLLFASGEIQPWANTHSPDETTPISDSDKTSKISENNTASAPPQEQQ